MKQVPANTDASPFLCCFVVVVVVVIVIMVVVVIVVAVVWTFASFITLNHLLSIGKLLNFDQF